MLTLRGWRKVTHTQRDIGQWEELHVTEHKYESPAIERRENVAALLGDQKGSYWPPRNW